MKLVSHLLRAGTVGGAIVALVASTESGERAGTGRCPAGETCSDATPEGLLFEGAPLGTWPALTTHTIAAGGRQTFRVTYPDSEGDRPFDLPFTAKTIGSYDVLGAGTDRVVIGASAEGSGFLRLVDDGGELYDRLAIDSAQIASVRAAPSYATAYPLIDPGTWAAYAGGQLTVSLVLADARGDSVVDEGLVLRSPVPSVRKGWDSFQLDTAASGIVTLAVDAGDVRGREVRVPVVATFDDVVPSAPASSGVGGTVTACFHAWLFGDQPGRTDDDTLVVGVPRTYRVIGPATPLASQQYGSCLELHTDGSGSVTVEATIEGRTWSTTIDVQGAGMREAPGLLAGLRAPTEGERAAMAHD